MNKSVKIWLIIAASLIVIGAIIFTGVMTVLKWDFTKLSTVKYQTNTHEITDNFKNLSIETDTADIDFVMSENDKILVVCKEQENLKHNVCVLDTTLQIKLEDKRQWYEHIGINFGNTKITVYLPQGEYGDLNVKNSTGDIKIAKDFSFKSIDIKGSTGHVTNLASVQNGIKIKRSTGDIKIENITAYSLDLTVSTGKINVKNIKCETDIKIKVSTGKATLTNAECKNLVTDGNTGDFTLENVKCSEKLTAWRSTGDVTLNLCDAKEITVKTDTGDVTGTLLSDKIFIVSTDTGKVDVPKSTTGGKCEITTDTGDIKIKISKE